MLPRLQALSGKVDGLLIGEGVVPPTRWPGWPGGCRWWSWPATRRARRRRGRGGQLVRARTRWSSHLVASTAGAGCSTSTARRPRPTPRTAAGHAGGHRRAPGRQARSARYSGRFSVRAARPRPSGCWPSSAARRRSCPTRSSAPTTRWPSACCGRSTARGDPGARGHRGGRLRRHLPRQPVRPAADHGPPADAHASASAPATGCSSGSPTPRCGPRVELLPTELVLRSSCGCPPGTVVRQPVAPLSGAAPGGSTGRGQYIRAGSRRATDDALRERRWMACRSRPPPGLLPGRGVGGADRSTSSSRARCRATRSQNIMAKFPNLQPSAYKALEAMLGVGHPARCGTST